jgi:lipopolysaccharide heptosyltransferase II
LILADDAVIYRGGLPARLKELFRLVGLLRKEKFDLVFVLHRAWQFNLLAFLAGIPRRVGFSRGQEGVFLTDRVAPVPARNEREAYLDLLRAINVPAAYEKSFFYLSPEEDRFLADFLKRHKIRAEDRVVGIGPGGGKNVKSYMPSRRWPVENYARLAKKLVQENACRVILFGGRDEKNLAARVLSECPECVDAMDLSYGEMASVFRRCLLYIGNDSGPLHIADAMGASTLSFFGPTNPLVQAPLGERSHVLSKKMECSPCYDDGRFPQCDHITCLNSIAVDEAWEKVKALLALDL